MMLHEYLKVVERLTICREAVQQARDALHAFEVSVFGAERVLTVDACEDLVAAGFVERSVVNPNLGLLPGDAATFSASDIETVRRLMAVVDEAEDAYNAALQAVSTAREQVGSNGAASIHGHVFAAWAGMDSAPGDALSVLGVYRVKQCR